MPPSFSLLFFAALLLIYFFSSFSLGKLEWEKMEGAGCLVSSGSATAGTHESILCLHIFLPISLWTSLYWRQLGTSWTWYRIWFWSCSDWGKQELHFMVLNWRKIWATDIRIRLILYIQSSDILLNLLEELPLNFCKTCWGLSSGFL